MKVQNAAVGAGPLRFTLNYLLFWRGTSGSAHLSGLPRREQPCFARLPGEHMWAPLFETAAHSKPVGGHIDSLHHVKFLKII